MVGQSSVMAGRTVAECTDRWFLCMIQAGTGHTSGLLSDLDKLGASYFHPIHIVRKVSKNGNPGPKNTYQRKTYQPLFPGYLFLNGDLARNVAFDSNHAYKIDNVANGMQDRLTGELSVVEYGLAKNPEMQAGPIFKKGVAVKIIHPHELAGTLARVSGTGDDGTVWVNIPLLNAGVPIQVDPELLERVKTEEEKQLTLLVCCRDCGQDTRNPSGLCNRCNRTTK